MKLTKGEYSQFSLKSRMQLLEEFGKLESEHIFEQKVVRIYILYDFYVQVIYDCKKEEIERVEPVTSLQMLHMYDLQ